MALKVVRDGEQLPPPPFDLEQGLEAVRRLHAAGCVGIAMIGESPEYYKIEAVPRMYSAAWALFAIGSDMTNPHPEVESE